MPHDFDRHFIPDGPFDGYDVAGHDSMDEDPGDEFGDDMDAALEADRAKLIALGGDPGPVSLADYISLGGPLLESVAGAVGVCRYCGCAEDAPCFVDGAPCSWFKEPDHHGIGVCSGCVRAYLADTHAP